jgi:hypothetical protein
LIQINRDAGDSRNINAPSCKEELIQPAEVSMRDLTFSQLMRRQTKLMDKMMARLGVNPAVAAAVDGSLAWHEARTKCLFCSNVLQCRAWLVGGAPQRGAAEFCPNRIFFQDCFSEIGK